jgi:sodium transport system permease protein
MTSPTEPRTQQLYQALAITGLGIATIYALQTLLGALGTGVLIAATVADAVTAAGLILLATRMRYDLGFCRPRVRFVVAAILVGITAWYLGLQLVLAIEPPISEQGLPTVIESGSLVPRLLGLALWPALAEEIVFRGALARGLAGRTRWWIGVLGSTVVFAAYHGVVAQMLGVLPIALALGMLAVRSGSVLPGMLAHLINNVIALLLARDALPGISRWIGARPEVALGAAAVVFAGGLALSAKGAT